jgi:hypothetical protein
VERLRPSQFQEENFRKSLHQIGLLREPVQR